MTYPLCGWPTPLGNHGSATAFCQKKTVDCSIDERLWDGNDQKARPKRALHYYDYQLPDHLYSLRENFGKRHAPMQTYTE